MIGFAGAQGVALAAIKGLDQKIDERAATLHDEARARQDEIALLKRELAELRRALDDLLGRVSPHAIPAAVH
jgi:chromosome segregation ATPase